MRASQCRPAEAGQHLQREVQVIQELEAAGLLAGSFHCLPKLCGTRPSLGVVRADGCICGPCTQAPPSVQSGCWVTGGSMDSWDWVCLPPSELSRESLADKPIPWSV